MSEFIVAICASYSDTFIATKTAWNHEIFPRKVRNLLKANVCQLGEQFWICFFSIFMKFLRSHNFFSPFFFGVKQMWRNKSFISSFCCSLLHPEQNAQHVNVLHLYKCSNIQVGVAEGGRYSWVSTMWFLCLKCSSLIRWIRNFFRIFYDLWCKNVHNRVDNVSSFLKGANQTLS